MTREAGGDPAEESEADFREDQASAQRQEEEGVEIATSRKSQSVSEDADHRKARKKAAKRRKAQQAVRERAVGKRGVCYISRLPPHMKPLKLRHLLSDYGEVLRIYLVPEDPAVRMRRKKAGGNSGKNFTEGWVEFAKKSVAKRLESFTSEFTWL